MTPQQASSGESGGRSAQEILDQVTAELDRFEARKLKELKSELEAFVKMEDALVADYGAKYAGLEKTWYERQLDAERLCAQLRCEFPPDDAQWKTVAATCVCTRLHDLCCLGQRIASRRRCSSGARERERDDAQAAFAAAKARLDTLKDLTKRIAAMLGDNLALVGSVDKLPSAQRGVAWYLVYFKFLPVHRNLAPYDVPEECMKVGSDVDPSTLCAEVYRAPCPQRDEACTPRDGPPAIDCGKLVIPRTAWLMDPQKYRQVLDAAWQDYQAAKDALGAAEAALKGAPDDLDSLVKQQAAIAAGLDDAIIGCLKSAYRPERDCKPPETRKGG